MVFKQYSLNGSMTEELIHNSRSYMKIIWKGLAWTLIWIVTVAINFYFLNAFHIQRGNHPIKACNSPSITCTPWTFFFLFKKKCVYLVFSVFSLLIHFHPQIYLTYTPFKYKFSWVLLLLMNQKISACMWQCRIKITCPGMEDQLFWWQNQWLF